MSFSSETKNAISRIEENKDCCILSELTALIYSSGTLLIKGKDSFAIKLSFELPALARRCFVLVRQRYKISPILKVVENHRFGGKIKYIISIENEPALQLLVDLNMAEIDENKFVLKAMYPQYAIIRSCCKKAFVRGAFLGAGSVQNPSTAYHLEISSQNEQLVKITKKIAKAFGIDFKQIIRRDKHVIYLKKSEMISDFLALVGANKAVMLLEDTLIKKQLMNNINRAMNCDNFNINKQLSASKKQIEDIEVLKQHLKSWPNGLEEVAELRLKNPEANMEQLAEMCMPPLSKSGVNHRLRRINLLANKFRKENEI